MTCESVVRLIPLYDCGELEPQEEDRLEAHLEECAACAREMDRHRALCSLLARNRAAVPHTLAEECRADLMAAIAGGAPMLPSPAKGPWKLFLEALGSSLAGLGRYQRPVGAVALLALGFVAARFTGGGISLGRFATPAITGEDVFATVRSVHPDESGRVQIAFDETHRRVVSGRMDDRNIQRLLLEAAHEENPAVRVESVNLLKNRLDSSEVKAALLNALAHDSNAGVRLMALEGIKPLAGDPEVRKTLAQVLLADDNAAVRMQAVDLLVTHRDDSMVGVLQNLVQKEDNGYVRLKCEKALKEMNASVGTF